MMIDSDKKIHSFVLIETVITVLIKLTVIVIIHYCMNSHANITTNAPSFIK